MPRMLDSIRSSEISSNVMQSASRGSLDVPPAEIIEILVYLALHNKVFGQQARLTLAGWDEKVCVASAGDAATSMEVLNYWISAENIRPVLLPALLENPSVREESLVKLSTLATRSVVEAMLASPRVRSSSTLLKSLQSNAILRPNEAAEIGELLAPPATRATPMPDTVDHTQELLAEEALKKFVEEHADELKEQKEKPFHAKGGLGIGLAGTAMAAQTGPAASSGAGHAAAQAHAPAGSAGAHPHPHGAPNVEDRRLGALQRIAKLDVKGRIALAIRGTKEDRSILIRDGTKLVSLAVLDSPKCSESEVEGFAQQKNLQEAVLRTIPMKRRFAKNYSIIRNLAFNPRTPVDASLGLIKHLLIRDLKNLSENKEVPDAVRKLAYRVHAQKMERQK